jgi:hypothetical protein
MLRVSTLHCSQFSLSEWSTCWTATTKQIQITQHTQIPSFINSSIIFTLFHDFSYEAMSIPWLEANLFTFGKNIDKMYDGKFSSFGCRWGHPE